MSETALRKAIIAKPDALLPRLVYADWLDEQGDCDLAHFIRLQCELSNVLSVFKTSGKENDRITQLEKEIRLAIIKHGEKWAKQAVPDNTTSGNFAAFDKLADGKYGQICRLPKNIITKDYTGIRSYIFDLATLTHWRKNSIDWREMPITGIGWTVRGLNHNRQDKSGIAFTNGFPSHWRGKCLDWFTKVGRSAVANYPIERVEFCDLIEYGGGARRVWNRELRKRFPTLCQNRHVGNSVIEEKQNQLSALAIEAVK